MTLVLSVFFSVSLVAGYSFTFSSEPQQCANLSFQISGSGEPPYSALVIPYGPSPLANGVEVRTIVSQQFPDDASSVSFQLNYPGGSQFIAVVSDNSGFGTGGTSVAASVLNSTDSSCFNASQTVSPDFPFNINPPNQIVQCSPTRLWWEASQVQGNTSFQGVIPGGDSFSIPQGTLTNATDMGIGFNWTPPVRASTILLIVAGDDRGLGTGGSGTYTVAAGLYPNSSCITNNSPSSTAGPPAGGSYPTNSSGGMTGGGSSSSSNTGAIVGGVIGGLAAIVFLGLAAFYVIRRKTRKPSKERPVNLLNGDPDDNEPSEYQPPPYLQPEPYLVTAPTLSSTSGQDDRRHSATGSTLLSDSLTSSNYYSAMNQRVSRASDPRSTTPDTELGILLTPSSAAMTSSRKSPMPSQLRAVNIIQHEDAGPSAQDAPEPETIELPPAYTNLRKEAERGQGDPT